MAKIVQGTGTARAVIVGQECVSHSLDSQPFYLYFKLSAWNHFHPAYYLSSYQLPQEGHSVLRLHNYGRKKMESYPGHPVYNELIECRFNLSLKRGKGYCISI